ncbi:hypothetical protein NIE79_006445 [Micromonospora sp. NIE79]|uniref:Nuclear transport factor 2 family protein n=1 Tax=Micromonospora trifolii TaxID=2911208 RepID=A0ABS9NE21_9ACTN|nr:hypothetical protein [Micromonospora trifolii]MCG5447509.1 hypothetical protein [Micromonospora trifolii]
MQPPAGSQVSRVPAQRTPSEQLPPAPATPAPQPPRRRMRTVLTVVAGVLALLCLGGVATALVWYNRASTPDRSTPDVVVANYIQSFLADRDDTRASEFVCQGGADIEGLRQLREDLIARELRFSTKISTSWEDFSIQRQGDSANVEVDLILSAYVDGVSQSDRQRWRFETRREDGWRVCKAGQF